MLPVVVVVLLLLLLNCSVAHNEPGQLVMR